MTGKYIYGWFYSVLFGFIVLAIPLKSTISLAEKLYNPIPLTPNTEVNDTLTDGDIPTGEGGFSKDYVIQLEKGDQVSIDLKSEDFDSLVILLGADGSTIGENDDGPDGGTNSLLFSRITEGGKYIVRVRAFGETGGGKFKVKVTRLRPVDGKL
ncbi:MAG: hypothetical protein N5P05_000572 [Chroococcopsis gigantea SAG 12.99]|jgi:hypothetical protein|nr:PPC domain-containing protein [Chlorogloea purpurea SAG 13.99]MDV2998966.1 hypothetical protein [Chroococcopsis gigantea SAG 12.99]